MGRPLHNLVGTTNLPPWSSPFSFEISFIRDPSLVPRLTSTLHHTVAAMASMKMSAPKVGDSIITYDRFSHDPAGSQAWSRPLFSLSVTLGAPQLLSSPG
jgi:hypothetical protein